MHVLRAYSRRLGATGAQGSGNVRRDPVRALLEAGRAFEQLKLPDMAKKNYDALVAKYKEAPEAALATERLKGA